jgi:hypothetical protein
MAVEFKNVKPDTGIKRKAWKPGSVVIEYLLNLPSFARKLSVGLTVCIIAW